MEIHKGKTHTITTDGITAFKSDGNRVRRMKYYPERDISALAGEIDELTAWQILSEVATQGYQMKTPITPEHILIEGRGFVLSEWSAGESERFTAPEGYSPVWALGATVFYCYLGCHVFQGLGGKGQTETTPIPTLRRDLPELSGLIISCLAFKPESRPKMEEVAAIAERNIQRCKARPELPRPLKRDLRESTTIDDIDAFWPEEIS